jgi:hypothetical protein
MKVPIIKYNAKENVEAFKLKQKSLLKFSTIYYTYHKFSSTLLLSYFASLRVLKINNCC